jgi:opacity protein-like surface antigen
MRQATLIAATLAGLVVAPAKAATSTTDAWQFEVTPYLYGSALGGTTGVGGVTADIDLSFGDILENLDSGFMMMFEARKGPWGLGFDGVYFRLKDQKTSSWQGPGGIGSATGELETTMTQQIYQLAASYRVLDAEYKIDAIGAARYTRLDTELDLVTTAGPLLPGGTRNLKESNSWWDPVIGARAIVPFAEGWSFVGYADLGGFGAGSRVTYQAIAGANWQFSPTFSAKAGYRYFYQDYDSNGFVWDMAQHGAYLGLGIRF